MLKNKLKLFIIKITKLFISLFFKIIIQNVDKLPKGDNYIVASNHSSYLDPPLLIVFLNNNINFIAKKELFKTFFISFFVKLYDSISVDRDNFNPITLKEAIKRLKNNKIVGIFPEGTRVKDLSKSKAYPGVSILAYYTNKLVIPIKIEGNINWKSQLFKNLLKFKKHNINIIIKDPISFKDFVKDKYNIGNINELPKDKLKEIFEEFADFVLKKIYE
jgi:1-acyl-sn-glycerol-3-phosphate acyltransferase